MFETFYTIKGKTGEEVTKLPGDISGWASSILRYTRRGRLAGLFVHRLS
jgi:hypothetical protein